MQGPCKHPKMSAWYYSKVGGYWRRDCLAYSCSYYETLPG